jgi:predicted nucleotidyltransferase
MISSEVKQYLVKVCTILDAHHVEYLVVGGAAVSHYGFNRPSGIGQQDPNLKVDLDFWYNPTIVNFQNIIRSLDQLDVETSDLKNLIFDKSHTFLKIPYKDFHMDFLPKMDGLNSFRLSKQNSELIDLSGVTVHILSLEDLVLNKRAVNRPADQIDINELNKIKKRKRHGKGL